MPPGSVSDASFFPPSKPPRRGRSERLEFHRIRQKIPQGFTRREDISRERRVLILKQGDDLEHQQVVALAKLRERRPAAPLVECPEALQQIVDLVLERQLGEYPDRAGIAQSLLEIGRAHV